MAKAPAFWKKPTFIALLLWPLSLIYNFFVWFDKCFKRLNLYWAGVPVISVGNLTVGGTGKTPVVAFLADYFSHKGEQVAILSRGYKGSEKAPYLVTWRDTAANVGDEPKMLFDLFKNSTVQVWVGANRTHVAKRAEQAGATVLILDDGFQHYHLARNIDIVVIDGDVGFGNGFCLPAGPLREPVRKLARANFALILNSHENKPLYLNTPAYRLKTTLNHTDVNALKKKKLLAFTGIGRPEKFFDSLLAQKLNVVKSIGFDDHHIFKEKTLKKLHEMAKKHNAHLVTTAKDAARLPTYFKQHVNIVRLELLGSDLENICAEIEELLR